MDQDSQKMFAEIVAKDPTILTEPEAEFLRARSSYLNEEQRAVFKEVLAQPEASDEKAKKEKAKKEE